MIILEMIFNSLFGLQSVSVYVIPVIAGFYFGLRADKFPSADLLIDILKISVTYALINLAIVLGAGVPLSSLGVLLFFELLLRTTVLLMIGIIIISKLLKRKNYE